MEDLLRAFFERDLTRDEEKKLDDLLEKSSQDAFQFLDIAKSLYIQTGLPDPEKSSMGGPSSSGPMMKALWGFLAGTAVTGAVWWATAHQAGTVAIVGPAPNPTVVRTELLTKAVPRPKLAPVTKRDRKTDGAVPIMIAPEPYVAGKKYGGLSAIVHQTSSGLLTVRILDPQGREIRLLYANMLDPGIWNFSWDGRDQQGVLTPAGVYQVEVQSGKNMFRKNVQIIRGQGP